MNAQTNAVLAQVQKSLADAALAIGALLDEGQPAKAPRAQKKARTVKAAPAEEAPNEFVTWLRATAEERHARKDTNRALAAELNTARPGWRGAANRDAIWAAAKAGKRIPAVRKAA